MALIHTIQIQGERHVNGTVSSTRKSENRRYAACIVATLTEQGVKLIAEARVAYAARVVESRVKLAALIAQYGCTVAEAQAWHDALRAANDDPETGLNATCKRIRATLGHTAASDGALFYEKNTQSWDMARAELAARGIGPIQASGTKYDVVNQARWLESEEKHLAGWKPAVAGSQSVLSWHGSIDNAQKELGGRTCRHYAERGYTLGVRTDIVVRETAKRAKVAS